MRLLVGLGAFDAAAAHTIGQRFSLEQVAQAHELVETGQEIGNVIIDL